DPPRRRNARPVHVGDFAAAVFETVDRDGQTHAHRIYLASGGAGKAELGIGPNGQRREPKKSARKTEHESTAGRAVIWGDASTAELELIFEGIETAAAAALAFQNEIDSRKMAIFACISAGGVEAFRPWPATKRVIVGTDRDEASKNERAPSRRGEIAARKFAALHHPEIAVSIALPGKAGDDIDWLDVLQRDGVEAVRSGILSADPYSPSSGPAANGAADDAEVARLAGLAPIAYDREREQAAERLGCRVATLDERVKAARGDMGNAPGQGRPINLPELKLWPEVVEGSILLDALSSTIREYVILSDEQADAVAVWSVHTHAHNASDVSPKLVLKSAQKRSGKTRLAQVMERLVARPLLVSGIR